MNTQLTHVAAKLNAYRLAVALSNKPAELVGEIYKEIFRGGFYRNIWDEPILLALQELIAHHPPNEEVYGEELEFLKDRTLQVVEINSLFAALLFGSSDVLPKPGVHIPDQPKVAEGLALLEANGTLDKIKRSSSQPREKLAAFVEELRTKAPSISELLYRCFESVAAQQELGAVNALLVTQPSRVGVVVPAKAMLQAGSGEIKPLVPIDETFRSAVDRACGALKSRGFLSTTQDVMFSANLTDATYSGSSIALGAAMAMFSSGRGWQFDVYTAFTGDINIKDHQWRVVRVEGIPEKLQAARQSGIRRVVLPRENEPDVPAACKSTLDIMPPQQYLWVDSGSGRRPSV
jgi:hypothetical protein